MKQFACCFLTTTNSLFSKYMCHDFDSQGPKSQSFNFWNCYGTFFVHTLSVTTYTHTPRTSALVTVHPFQKSTAHSSVHNVNCTRDIFP